MSHPGISVFHQKRSHPPQCTYSTVDMVSHMFRRQTRWRMLLRLPASMWRWMSNSISTDATLALASMAHGSSSKQGFALPILSWFKCCRRYEMPLAPLPTHAHKAVWCDFFWLDFFFLSVRFEHQRNATGMENSNGIIAEYGKRRGSFHPAGCKSNIRRKRAWLMRMMVMVVRVLSLSVYMWCMVYGYGS